MASRSSLADMLRNELEIDSNKSTSELSKLFDEEPPPLDVFVADQKYLNNPTTPLSGIQFDFVRHMEQIFRPETYVLMVEEFGAHWLPVRFVNELVGEWGKGSGKDHSVQVGFARVANLLLCLRSPQDYYGLPHQTIIHMLNVAASAPQAHGVFFKPLRKLLTSSEWFSGRFEGDPPGPQATEVRFNKQIELISGHSQAETLEGKNLLISVADEISAFPTKDEVAQSKTGRVPSKTSDSILEMLRSSATTRFPENFKLVQISYPRYKGDAIERAIQVGKADNLAKGAKSRYYVSGPLPTWEVNPRYASYERIPHPGAHGDIPNVSSIVEDYDRDPAYSRAKYECLPELSENRYIQNDAAIVSSFAGVLEREPLSVSYRLAETQGVTAWEAVFSFAPDFLPKPGALYSIHGDLAISGDKAGVALAHVASWEDREWEDSEGYPVRESKPLVHVDFVTCFQADKSAHPEREVQIRWFRELIRALLGRGFLIQHASCDNFQSADTLQILKTWGVDAKVLSTDRSDNLYATLRDLLYDGRLVGYYRESLIKELRTLTRLRNGKVDHPPLGSKDEADALAGAIFGALSVGGREWPADEDPLAGFSDYNMVSPPVSLDLHLGFSVDQVSSMPWGDTNLHADTF